MNLIVTSTLRCSSTSNGRTSIRTRSPISVCFFKFFTYSRPYIWIQYPRFILDSLIKILPNSFISFCHISSQFRHTVSLLIMYYTLKLSIFTNILSHLINSYISFITVQQLLVTLLSTHWHIITYFYHTLICYTI